MPIARFAAHECFVHFDDAHQPAEILLGEASANAMAHIPSRPVGAKAHRAVDLQCADPFLASQHEVDYPEPFAQRFIGVFKDRAADVRETVVGRGRGTDVAEPVPFHRAMLFDGDVTAARAGDPIRPAMSDEIGAACILVREGPFPLRDGHLGNLRRLFCAGHLALPLDSRDHAASD